MHGFSEWYSRKGAHDLLVQLWMAGLPTSEIGERFGVSKNAIVGRVHRLKLPPRPSPIRPKGSGKRPRSVPPAPDRRERAHKRIPKPGVLMLTALGPAPYTPPRVSSAPLCQWIEPWDDGPRFKFTCTHFSVESRSYCRTHVARIYKPRGAGMSDRD